MLIEDYYDESDCEGDSLKDDEPDTYTFSSWFERDRAHLCLTNDLTDETILEFWDDDVKDIVELGFIDPRDYEGSMRKYAKYLGVI